MIRNVSLDEISDGRLYSANDMVKADCHDCEGCSKCCHNMGNSIQLDPYDVVRLQKGTERGFRELLADAVELSMVDGLTLPNLKMNEESGHCHFLNQEGRCSIHASRPGICRLFPLGRYYHDGGFSYFLQVHECVNQKRSKIKVKKWVDTSDLKNYEVYITAWHSFLKSAEKYIAQISDEEEKKNTSLYVLMNFYIRPYDLNSDFYPQFYERLKAANELLDA